MAATLSEDRARKLPDRLVVATADLQSRLVWSLMLAGASLLATLVGGPLYVGLVGAFAMLALLEWLEITGRVERLYAYYVAISVVLVLAALCLSGHSSFAFAGAFALVCFAFASAVKAWRWQAFGLGYCALAIGGLFALRLDDDNGLLMIAFLSVVVWATDSCAYFAGRIVGGPRLSPAISPSKTWSGAIGGAIGGAVIGVAVLAVFTDRLGPIHLVLALLLSIVSQLGDLGESWLKRRFKVKDASQLIPGHGGMLDRVDGLMAAAVAAYLIGAVRGGAENAATGFLIW